MARWEFKLPDIGEGVTEGEIVSWLIKPGDHVTEDQPMVEVMTDKATVTITAPKSGVVVETRGKVGEIVAVHSVLVVFELQEGAGAGAAGAAAATNGANGHAKSDDGPAATAVGDIKDTLPGMSVAAGPSGAGAVQGYYNEKPRATPATRKLARDMNVDLRQVQGTGPQGRVTKRDVESFKGPTATSTSTTTATRTPIAIPAPTPTAPVHIARGPLEERVPFAGVRRKIAQKMAQSKHTAAHFTFVEECDVTKLKALRASLKAPAEAQGVKLSFLPFIVKAVTASLKKHPMLNTALDETTNELVFRKYFHIGIATATEAGLIVPVVKDADRKSIVEIAREIERLSSDARTGKAKLE